MAMDVRILVFNNGLQLIGDYTEKKDQGCVVICKPVQLVMVPNTGKEGQMGMAFAPFLQFTEEWSSGLPFMVSDILTVATPTRDLLNIYSTGFGSGLVLPPGVGQG